MIDYIKGEITELTPTSVTVECNGIGYQANISLNTYSALNGQATTRLYIVESIREDAHQLFGLPTSMSGRSFASYQRIGCGLDF